MANSYHDAIIQAQVHKITEKVLIRAIDNPCFTISPSAYDTAWVAMIGDPKENYEKPMFGSCLEWILNNQKSEGFWGEQDYHGNPTISSLIATLACMVALKTWKLGHEHIARGMAFINANSTKLLLQLHNNNNDFPRWFAIVFPGIVELARCTGLQVLFDEEVKETVALVFQQQHEILTSEVLVDMYHYPPLLSYLEVLPPNFPVNVATLLSNMNGEGSLFRSPSATAAAYMATRNTQMLSYLCHLVDNTCNGGVPSLYPIDEDYIPIYMVNQLQRLGLSTRFPNIINDMLEHIHREYNAHKPSELCGLIPENIYKSSLAFQLLRFHGYRVSARKFCWFLNDEYALKYIEENHEKFTSILYNLYRATYLMFESEDELQKLRSFSRKLLAKSSLISQNVDDSIMLWPSLHEKIKCELATPWLARMDHLEHREWIESANKGNPLWLGKSSYFRIPCLDDGGLIQLAKENYELRQKVYQKELGELIRWSKIWGLMDMGFAREKTTYCYFAVASATSLPYDSYVRLIVAKSAVLVTIFDDYFDMVGSLDELQILANAVKRWNIKGLKSHGKILFDALDSFVSEVANKYFDQYGIDIVDNLRKIWYEVVDSWLTEATWSKTGHIPPMDSYLETGMISIAAHILVLQASCFLTPSLSPHKLNPFEHEYITKLLMISCRLLNDLQSYEKEIKDGKINSVYIYMKENPEANIEDAIHYVENLLEETKMKLLELALMDGNDVEDLPKPCKRLHLTALKVFQMFFNSANHFDSKDSLLNDINKAIFIPLEPHTSLHHSEPQPLLPPPKKPRLVINSYNKVSMKYHGPWKPNHRFHCTFPAISTGSRRMVPLMKVYSSKFNFFVTH